MMQNAGASAAMMSAKEVGNLAQAWESDIAAYRLTRARYLLYPN
jgi:hypothetical protein